MRRAPSRPGAGSIAAWTLRVAALAILSSAILRPLGALTSLPLTIVLILLCSASGYALASLRLGTDGSRRLRPWLLATALTALPFALRLLGGWVLEGLALILSTPATEAARRAEFLLLSLDQAFWTLAPLAVWAGLSAWLALRSRPFLRLEPLLNAPLFLLAFWRESGFTLTHYAHPVHLALASGSVILLDALRLVLAGTESARHSNERNLLRTAPKPGEGSSPRRPRPERLASPIAVSLLMALLFLLLLGRWNDEAASAGAGLIKPNIFSFDFSRFIRLEPEISLDNKDLVLVLRKDETDDNWLTRRFILSGYAKERGFYQDERPWMEEVPLSLPGRRHEWEKPSWKGRRILEQEYYILNFDRQAFIAMDQPFSSQPLAPWPGSSFKSVYRVESLVPAMSRSNELSGADGTRADGVPPPGMSEEEWRYYTRWGDDKRIRELALSVASGRDDYWGKAMAIQEYFHSEYLYSLRPGIARDGDQLGRFLFETKKGYCSYFAFGMTLMLRSLGVPARVAAGFFIRPDSGILSLYPVRADMAHAWVEVFFPERGWIDFDPTSTNLAPGEGLSFGDLPDPSTYLPLVQEILKNRDSLLPTETAPGAREAAEGLAEFFGRAARKALASWYLILPALLGLAVLARNLLLLLPIIAARDGRSRRAAAFDILLARRSRSGFRRHKASTRLEHCAALDRAFSAAASAAGIAADAHARLASLAEANLHGPDFGPDDEAAWECALRDAQLAWRAAVPAWRRAAAYLFLPIPPVKGAAAALLLFMCILALAQSDAGESADELLSRANDALYAEDWEGAEALFKRGMALHPDQAAFPRGLGKLYRDKGLDLLAFDAWRRAEELAPDDSSLLYDMSSTLSRLNRNADAVSYLERCVALNPSDLDAISDLGWEYFKVHRTKEGIELLERATRDFGFNRSFAMTLGTLHSDAYEYEASKRQYELAIRDAENNWAMRFASVAWYNLSILESRFYRFDLARVAADKAVSAWDRSSARLASGELWQRMTRLGSARREYQAAAENDDSPLSEQALAEVARLAGDPEGSARALQSILDRADKTWMANFGTDPDAHSKDVLDSRAEALEGFARMELSRPDSSIVDRLRALASSMRLRSLAWLSRERYRRLSWAVAESYRREGALLLSEVNAYNAMEGHPRIALRHLRAARAFESARIPAADPSYMVEEELLMGRASGILDAIGKLDQTWERDIAVDALFRAAPLARGRTLRARMGRALFALAPGMVRQAGLHIEASIDLESDDARATRRLRRVFLGMLSRGGIKKARSSEETPFVLSVRMSGGSLTCSLLQAEDGSLLGSWSGPLASESRRDLAAAASSFLAAAFADPGL